MIKIKIILNKQNDIKGIKVSGHADFAEIGKDIVCAGVSSLTYTLLNGLETIVGIKPICKVSKGNASCILPDNLNEEQYQKSQLILKTIVLGYQNIEKSYNDFVKVIKEEV